MADTTRSGIGVLLVHGMGSAADGDTLRNVGGPLFRVLGDRAGAAGLAVGPLTTAVLAGSDAGPAHVAFEVTGPDGRRPWWVAECHWGDSFRPPGYRQVLTWLVLVLPWTLIGYLHDKSRYLRRAGDHGAERSLITRQRVLAVVALLSAVVLAPLLAAVVVVVLVLVVPLSRVPVDAVSTPATAVVRAISASLGDVYVLASESFDRRAVDQRLERDLSFLLERCERVAVVAHSAGSYLTHCMLQKAGPSDLAAPDRVPLLITYGQAVWRVHAVKQLEEGGGRRTWAVFFSLFALAVSCLAGWLGVSDRVVEALLVSLVGVAGCIGAFTLVLRAADVADDGAALGLAAPRRWRDYASSADPVPNGLMPPQLVGRDRRGAPRSYEGVRVHNRRSVLTDHSAYVANEDVFLDGVARDLLRFAGHSPGDRAELDDAWVRRRGRTRWLSTARATYAACAALLLVAASWVTVPIDLDRSPAMRVGAWLARRLPTSWTESLFGITGSSGMSVRGKIVGVLALAGLLLLGYLLVRVLWASWDRRVGGQGRPPAIGTADGDLPAGPDRSDDGGQRFLGGWLAVLTVVAALGWWLRTLPPADQRLDALPFWLAGSLVLCACAVVYTVHPGRRAQDALGVGTWDGGSADAEPAVAPCPAVPVDDAGWQALLTLPPAWQEVVPHATGVLVGVVRDGDRVCLESCWEDPRTDPSAPVVLRVAQVVEVIGGSPVTMRHYVDVDPLTPSGEPASGQAAARRSGSSAKPSATAAASSR